jgi:hypothetical protein
MKIIKKTDKKTSWTFFTPHGITVLRAGVSPASIPQHENSKLEQITKIFRKHGLECYGEPGTGGYLFSSISRNYRGCRVNLSLRVDPNMPHKIFSGPTLIADGLVDLNAVFVAIKRYWRAIISTIHDSDLVFFRKLRKRHLVCSINITPEQNGRRARHICRIGCTGYKPVIDSKMVFSMELGKKACYLNLMSGRRYKVQNSEILLHIVDRMISGELDLRQIPTKLSASFIKDAHKKRYRRLKRQPIQQGKFQSQNNLFVVYQTMFAALRSGQLDSLECPKCHKQTVSVWFNHPVKHNYQTWFVCAVCTFKFRITDSERPRHYSPKRRNEHLNFSGGPASCDAV